MQSRRCNPGDATTGLPTGLPTGHMASVGLPTGLPTGLPQTYLLDDACHQGARWESRAIRGEARETRRQVPDEGCHHEVSSGSSGAPQGACPSGTHSGSSGALGFVRGTRVRHLHSGSSGALGFVRGTRVRHLHSGSSGALGTHPGSSGRHPSKAPSAAWALEQYAECTMRLVGSAQPGSTQFRQRPAAGTADAPPRAPAPRAPAPPASSSIRCSELNVHGASPAKLGMRVGASVAKQWPSAESVPVILNQTQSDAIRRNQAQSEAHRSMRPKAE
jgi:hypothetical protein